MGLLQPPRRPHRRWSAPACEVDASSHDDLDVEGQARPRPRRPQRPARRRRRSPTTAGSGRRVPLIRRPASSRARGSSSARTSAGPRARRTRVLPARRSPRGSGELLGQPVRLRQRRRRRVARRPSWRARGTARSRCWRTCASRRARRARTTPSAARSPTSWPPSPTSTSTTRFGAVHRKHASVYDVAQRLPHAAGPLVAAEVEVLQRLTEDPERPYVVVLGGSKVSDKLAVIEALLPKVDTAARRRRHVLHLPQGPGPRGRQLAAPGGPARPVPRASSTRRQRVVLPVDVRGRHRVRRRRRRTRSSPPTRSRPTGWASTSGRDRVELFARRARPAPRPSSGTARWASSSSRRSPTGTRGGRRGDRIAVDGVHRRRRRRLRRRRARARHRRGALRPHLHRWRGQPGVPRGQDPARPRRPGGTWQ